ncbi:MAG: DUF5809 family protein [Halobacteriaceae archaeon]
METLGEFAPATPEAVADRFEALGPVAQTVTKEVAKAMEFDAEEYRSRVTSDVVETAREALFASLLEVHVGTRAEFESAVEASDYEVVERGHPDVERVVWHVADAADTVVAATFAEEQAAAVGTLRRQAFGEVYRDLLGLDDE